ncbi:MAG: type II 3-dehydroquinate dehydratase [Fimbriimonadales bacterium]|nr:type II 3-dehydroquinate dehydratase [Fimbriimonadales bacterium]
MHKVLLLNGPNLNLLGEREPAIYGSETLESIVGRASAYAQSLGIELHHVQSNHEGALIDALHAARDWAEGVILNAGAYTHTSVALRDAISAVGLPTIEVHLSNIYAREPFRHTSLIAPVCVGSISGFGADSYLLAVQAMAWLLQREQV